MADEFKIRQLKLILRQIDHYKKGDMDVFELAPDLRFLRNQIRDFHDHWEGLDDLWALMDEAIAMAVEVHGGKIASYDQAEIDAAIPNVIKLVQAELESEGPGHRPLTATIC